MGNLFLLSLVSAWLHRSSCRHGVDCGWAWNWFELESICWVNALSRRSSGVFWKLDLVLCRQWRLLDGLVEANKFTRVCCNSHAFGREIFLITELVLHQGPTCMWALIGLAVSCQVVARSMVSKSIPHSFIMLWIDSSEARLFNALKSLSALHLES